jgi:hypothetical protein
MTALSRVSRSNSRAAAAKLLEPLAIVSVAALTSA